jgi:hypothetical protein
MSRPRQQSGWAWSSKDQQPEQVPYYRTGKDNYVFIPSAVDARGGRTIWAGGMYDSEDACWAAEIRRAEHTMEATQRRLDHLIERREQSRATA